MRILTVKKERMTQRSNKRVRLDESSSADLAIIVVKHERFSEEMTANKHP